MNRFSRGAVKAAGKPQAWSRKPRSEAGAIDFDLTTDTNAFELKGFEIKIKSRSGNAAVLTVKPICRERGPLRVVTYDFIREGGIWRIDNFSSTIFMGTNGRRVKC